VQPAALTIFGDTTITQEILVTDSRPQPLAVTAACTNSSWLQSRIIQPDRNVVDHQVCRIRLEVAGICSAGRHDESVVISTSDPRYRELTVPVTIIKRAGSGCR
jgi:hypothetical protein